MFLFTRSFTSSLFPLLLRHLSDYSYQKHLQIKIKQKQDHDSGGSKGKAGGEGGGGGHYPLFDLRLLFNTCLTETFLHQKDRISLSNWLIFFY